MDTEEVIENNPHFFRAGEEPDDVSIHFNMSVFQFGLKWSE